MLKIILLSATALIAVVNCCEKPTFIDAQIKASKYFHTTDDPDDIKLEQPLTGCITPTEELKGALKIVVKNQNVPVLHEGAVQDLEWLHELIMENNGIESIEPGAFKNLPTISTIVLSSNQLNTIPEGVFNEMAVKRLDLSRNSISSIAPTAFDKMPNLIKIVLDHNSLKEWNSDWFTNTPNIEVVSAGYNEISELPDGAFKNFNGNHPVVNGIFLSNNKIANIHVNAFKNVKQLYVLDLDHNSITSLAKGTFAGFESIKNLLLHGNKITCLSDLFLRSLPPIETITVNENPINCDCLKKMKKWASKNNIEMRMHIRSIECMQERIKNVLDSVKDVK